jgi:dihydroorotase (multifunctional complex type)
MTPDLLVSGGRCVLPGGVQDADLAIADGRIVAIVQPGVIREARARLDVAGRFVLPGVIDAHVHVRDPGQTHKEDYAHASRAAAVGGVTTMISQPNTVPAITDVQGFAAVVEAARLSRVDHAICAGILAAAPDPRAVGGLAEAGAVAFEVLDDTGPLDGAGWLSLFDAVAPTGRPLAFLAADRAVMRRNLEAARARPGAGWRDFSRVISGEAEMLGYARAAALARISQVPLIVRQVTTAAGLQTLRQVKRAGSEVPVWVEVNVHHLFLTDEDLERQGPYAHMVPPPRPAEDVAALWLGINDGTVDFVSTDHAPHTREEKERGRVDLWTAPTGIPGLDSFAKLLVDAALTGRLSLERLAELVAGTPSRLHRLDHLKGAIRVGVDADLVVIDPAADWQLDEQHLHTRCGWSAFAGRRGRGALVATLLRGQLIAKDGIPLDAPIGRLLTPR